MRYMYSHETSGISNQDDVSKTRITTLSFFFFFLSYLPMVKNHARAITLETYNKRKKGLPLETKNSQNHENWRLGLIESLHMQL